MNEGKGERNGNVSVRDFVKNRTNVCNGLIAIVLYMTCPFCYYMLTFNIKYFPGDIYTNQIVNSVAEAIGNGPLLILIKYLFTFKTAFQITFVSCVISFTCIILCIQYNWVRFIPWAVLMTKASVAVPNALTFVTIPEYFEPQFAGLVLSVVNILGRINNAATPMIAELPEPVPILVCIFFCVMAFFSVTMLRRNESFNKV